MQASLEDNIIGFDSPRMKTHIQTTEKGNEEPEAKKLKKVQEKGRKIKVQCILLSTWLNLE